MKFSKITMFIAGSLIIFSGTKSLAISDDQITELMETANEAEIDAAKTADSRASSSVVKDYANKMINEHKDSKKEGKQVAKDEKIKMVSSDASKALKKDASETLKDLKSKKGTDYDKAYIASQVEMHKKLLNDLDSKLIPEAKNQKLKSYLEATRSHVQEHLNKAEEVQATLK